MHPRAVRTQALALVAAGLTDSVIARRLALPRTTVRDWRSPPYLRRSTGTCPRCWRATRAVRFAPQDYAELLGLYLGDGHISAMPRTQRLRLSLDSRYPGIVADAQALLERCFPANRVHRLKRDDGATTVVMLYHGHLSCLFPQHGTGRKHERRIVLEPWQRSLVGCAPWAFLRGCIRSDGCVFINRTGKYEYLSYEFCNHSADLLGLFADVCASVGLSPRRYEKRVRLCRRQDVARLVERVGGKS